jgi:hypothetical protein
MKYDFHIFNQKKATQKETKLSVDSQKQNSEFSSTYNEMGKIYNFETKDLFPHAEEAILSGKFPPYKETIASNKPNYQFNYVKGKDGR